MPAEVFFAPRDGAGTLTAPRLVSELAAAGYKSTVIEDKSEQVWVEFSGFQSRLLLAKEPQLSLVTFQLYGDVEREGDLLDEIEKCMDRHGYIDADDLADES